MAHEIDDVIMRMRLLQVDHEPEGWPAVRMRDISAMLREIESWEEQASQRTDDAVKFATENRRLRAALDEIRHSTYLRHATSVAAAALGHEV